MGDYEHEPDGVWDEYAWERFLQQQDRKTEKYMELLEKYIDDPNRDQLIAREMGWNHLLDENATNWSAEIDAAFAEEMEALEELEENENAADEIEPETFEYHPLYRSAFAL